MIFIDVSQYSKGQERADDRAFKNLNNLIATDRAIQQNDEFFLGAPGREQAISLESQRQLGVADAIGPNLSSIVAADANSILGAAATRSVAGLQASAEAQFTLPAIPVLAQSAVDTRVATQLNRQNQAEVLVPGQQAITASDQINTLNNQPLTQQIQRTQLEGVERRLGGAEQTLDYQTQQGTMRAATDLQLEGQAGFIRGQIQDIQQSANTNKILTQPQQQRLEQLQRQYQTLQAEINIRTAPKAEQSNNQMRAYNDAVTKGRMQRLPQENDLKASQTFLQQMLTDMKVGNVPSIDKLADADRALKQLQVAAKTADQPEQAKYDTAQLALNNIITKIKNGNAILEDEYRDAVRAYNMLVTASNTANQPAAAQVTADQTALKQGQTDQAISNLTDDATIADLTRKLRIGELEYNQLSAPQQQRIATDQRKIKESNIGLAISMLPVTQLAQTLQQGIALDDIQQLKKNKGYAYEVQDINAQQAPLVARRQQYAQSLQNGGTIIQRLNVKRPISLTANELATAGKQLQDNGLLNPGQSLRADSTGIYIQSAGAAPIPLDSLYQGILATTSAPTKPKPTTYKTTTYIQDGVAYPVNTVTSTGAPPTTADRQFAGGGAQTPAAGTVPPPSLVDIIGAPAAKAALDEAARKARGY